MPAPPADEPASTPRWRASPQLVVGAGGSAEVVLTDISDPGKVDALFDDVSGRRGGDRRRADRGRDILSRF
jgi:hypothetical protein